MPYHINKSNGSFKVTGPFKGAPGHVYGTHTSEESARQQQKALYANTKEASVELPKHWATEYLEMKTAANSFIPEAITRPLAHAIAAPASAMKAIQSPRTSGVFGQNQRQIVDALHTPVGQASRNIGSRIPGVRNFVSPVGKPVVDTQALGAHLQSTMADAKTVKIPGMWG